MASRVACAPCRLSVVEGARRISETEAAFLVLQEGDRVVGVLDEGELLRLMVSAGGSPQDPLSTLVAGQVIAFSPGSATSDEAAFIFAQTGASRLVVLDDRGGVLGVVTAGRLDGSGSNSALAEPAMLLRMIMERSRDGIVIHDAEGSLCDANTSFAALVGYSREELKGMRFWAAKDVASWKEGEFFFETQVRCKGGNVRDVEVASNSIEYRGGEHYFCVCRDVTERNAAESTLREREALYSAIFHKAPDGVVLIDAATQQYLEFNEAASSMHGFTREEFSRLTSFEINAEMSAAEVISRAKEIEACGHATFDTVHRHKDGSLRNIRANLTSVQLKGRLCLVGFWTDITRSMLLEEQLRQSQKMEAVGQLAGGIAHDFNNILTAIIGFAHIIEAKLADNSPLRASVNHILHSAERAATLTGDLLTFSRKRVLDLRPTSLNDSIAKTEKILKRLIREDITLSVSCACDPLTVMADESQFTQILMNLTSNARDAMPDGGRISISTSSFQMDQPFIEAHGFGRVGRFALITFSDTGCGMDEVTRKKVFEPFFTTKALGKGTGLGLATVYGVVKQLEGFINVYSEPGLGTVFRIYLPEISTMSMPMEASGAAAPAPGGQETILLAEDDTVVRELVAALLREAGYNVIQAKDGVAALQLFREEKGVDLLVLDAIMPGKNGIDVLRQALKLRPEVKAIMLSGYASDNMAIDWQLRAGVKYLQKPISPRPFLEAVRGVLDHRAAR